MSDSGVEKYFSVMQDQLASSLGSAGVVDHPVAKGDEAEVNWLEMLDDHLPVRYRTISKAFVVDVDGSCSDEIDILVCDRQYSTLIFKSKARTYVPAEAVYAVIEVKPEMSRANIIYASKKVRSVRTLRRTSAPIVTASGVVTAPRQPSEIIGCLVAARSAWRGGFGDSFVRALDAQESGGRLTAGCTLGAGGWTATYGDDGLPVAVTGTPAQALVHFYLRLLALLQLAGTAPAMDYGEWSRFLVERGK